MNSGVYASLHPNCHHQIIYTSFNLNITYPPPYKRLIWDYNKADSDKIRKSLDWVNWECLFNNKDVNTQVAILNETVLNVFSDYAPNKYITINDKDPVWMNEIIKLKIKAKNSMYNRFIQNGRSESDFVLLETLITELNELIATTEALYCENLAEILSNPLLQAKTYWSILKTFYNGKKIPLIPPLLVRDKFVTNMKTKAVFFQ